MAISLEESLLSLASSNQWKMIIDLEPLFPREEKSKFLWAWPNSVCLDAIYRVLCEMGATSILSIGCGSGLLEWIINRATGIPVAGLELDQPWWSSAYAPRTFIDLNFTNSQITSDFLCKCVNPATTSASFALLFCYFNNREAFLKYVSVFPGNLVIIIGPIDGAGIVTDPTPLNPKFGDQQWVLIEAIEMQTKQNYIAFYRRKKKL